MVARLKFFQRRSGIVGFIVTVFGVHRVAIGGVGDEQHFAFALLLLQAGDETSGKTVIVVGTGRLNVGVILIDAQIHLSHAVVVPYATTIHAGLHASTGTGAADDLVAGLPHFGSTRV